MIADCNKCDYVSHPKQFGGSLSPYHDLRCPACNSTDIDTSDLNKEIPGYSYGDDNFLKPQEAPDGE